MAYKLVPYAHPPLMAHPDSLIAKRAVFATHNLWVTPHDDDQMYPAGKYVFQADRCTGLSQWTKEVSEEHAIVCQQLAPRVST